MQNTLGGGGMVDRRTIMVIPKREVVYEFSSNIAVAYRKVHTSLKFAQLSGSYVVVQDFPSIIGEEETLQRAS